jgi:hypothetical protein
VRSKTKYAIANEITRKSIISIIILNNWP